jgi:hypothetical protein
LEAEVSRVEEKGRIKQEAADTVLGGGDGKREKKLKTKRRRAI